jgi:hypothetical protein
VAPLDARLSRAAVQRNPTLQLSVENLLPVFRGESFDRRRQIHATPGFTDWQQENVRMRRVIQPHA